MRHMRILLTVTFSLMLGAATLTADDDPVRPAHSDSGLAWYDVSVIGVEGKGWTDTKASYDRLPARAEGVVRKPVWGLSRDAAGLCVRFATDAPSISVAWDGGGGLQHMPATGRSGLDLFVRREGQWRFTRVARPEQEWTVRRLFEGRSQQRREYLMYLPLYNSVSKVEIGVPDDCTLWRLPKPEGKPVVFYGTSITQGGCASRPGNVHTAILGRWLEREVINLGFSGNGRMEPEMAELISEIDPAVLLIDCIPNVGGDIGTLTEPFMEIYRKRRPDTPVLLVENIRPSDAAANRLMREAWQRLIAAGDEHIHLLECTMDVWLNGDATVDGVHPTDLGFLLMAKWMQGPIGVLLK
ncbi:MAG: hypothetical protein FVQ81_04750 [Candidatus Glassbacteria bacterium]|nr:hypothetical protein [Candidatus Glassbacteria bacterium]